MSRNKLTWPKQSIVSIRTEHRFLRGELTTDDAGEEWAEPEVVNRLIQLDEAMVAHEPQPEEAK